MRKFYTIILLSFILCNPISFAQNLADDYMRNPSLALKDAESYFQTGDYEKSIKIINIYSSLSGKHDGDELLSNAKSCIELWNKIELYEKENNLESVKQCCEQILAINSQDQNARNRLESCKKDKGVGIDNGHEWVDLGLSVKWATSNIGASSNIMSGAHFAWSEITYKSKYIWSNLKYVKKIKSRSVVQFSKYVTTKRYGKVDQKSRLDLSDDAARANWGGEWRIPTVLEMKELIDSCSWSWTTQNGEYGYQVTSKINGNSIFLPAAGCIYNSSLEDNGEVGFYWSSSLSGDDSSKANGLYFNANRIVPCYGSRSYGFSVRPVCQ